MNYRELQASLKELRNQGIVDSKFRLNQKKHILMEEYTRATNIKVSPEKNTDVDEVSLLKARVAELEKENAELKAELELASLPIPEPDKDDLVWEDRLKIDEACDRLTRGVNVYGDVKGSILDMVTDGTCEQVQKEQENLETLVKDEPTPQPVQEIEYEVIECLHGEVINREVEISVNIVNIADTTETSDIADIAEPDSDENSTHQEEESIIIQLLYDHIEEYDNFIHMTPIRKNANMEREQFDATLWRLVKKDIIDISTVSEAIRLNDEDFDAAIKMCPDGFHETYHFFITINN